MKKDRDEHWMGLLESLAQEKLGEVLERAEEHQLACENELKEQLNGYEFSCKKHGNFLALFITQVANENAEWEKFPKKLITTVNLSLAGTITRGEGSGVTRDASIGFKWKLERIDKSIPLKVHKRDDVIRDPETNEHYVVTPDYPSIKSGRNLFIEYNNGNTQSFISGSGGGGGGGGCHGGGGGGMHMPHLISFKVPNYPCEYTPDEIYFKGVGRIMVPHGRGEEVYKIILEEFSS